MRTRNSKIPNSCWWSSEVLWWLQEICCTPPLKGSWMYCHHTYTVSTCRVFKTFRSMVSVVWNLKVPFFPIILLHKASHTTTLYTLYLFQIVNHVLWLQYIDNHKLKRWNNNKRGPIKGVRISLIWMSNLFILQFERSALHCTNFNTKLLLFACCKFTLTGQNKIKITMFGILQIDGITSSRWSLKSYNIEDCSPSKLHLYQNTRNNIVSVMRCIWHLKTERQKERALGAFCLKRFYRV